MTASPMPALAVTPSPMTASALPAALRVSPRRGDGFALLLLCLCLGCALLRPSPARALPWVMETLDARYLTGMNADRPDPARQKAWVKRLEAAGDRLNAEDRVELLLLRAELALREPPQRRNAALRELAPGLERLFADPAALRSPEQLFRPLILMRLAAPKNAASLKQLRGQFTALPVKRPKHPLASLDPGIKETIAGLEWERLLAELFSTGPADLRRASGRAALVDLKNAGAAPPLFPEAGLYRGVLALRCGLAARDGTFLLPPKERAAFLELALSLFADPPALSVEEKKRREAAGFKDDDAYAFTRLLCRGVCLAALADASGQAGAGTGAARLRQAEEAFAAALARHDRHNDSLMPAFIPYQLGRLVLQGLKRGDQLRARALGTAVLALMSEEEADRKATEALFERLSRAETGKAAFWREWIAVSTRLAGFRSPPNMGFKHTNLALLSAEEPGAWPAWLLAMDKSALPADEKARVQALLERRRAEHPAFAAFALARLLPWEEREKALSLYAQALESPHPQGVDWLLHGLYGSQLCSVDDPSSAAPGKLPPVLEHLDRALGEASRHPEAETLFLRWNNDRKSVLKTLAAFPDVMDADTLLRQAGRALRFEPKAAAALPAPDDARADPAVAGFLAEAASRDRSGRKKTLLASAAAVYAAAEAHHALTETQQVRFARLLWDEARLAEGQERAELLRRALARFERLADGDRGDWALFQVRLDLCAATPPEDWGTAYDDALASFEQASGFPPDGNRLREQWSAQVREAAREGAGRAELLRRADKLDMEAWEPKAGRPAF